MSKKKKQKNKKVKVAKIKIIDLNKIKAKAKCRFKRALGTVSLRKRIVKKRRSMPHGFETIGYLLASQPHMTYKEILDALEIREVKSSGKAPKDISSTQKLSIEAHKINPKPKRPRPKTYDDHSFEG